MDPYQYRVEINPNVTFAIACYAEHTILKLLGFESQSTVIETPQKLAVGYRYLVQIWMFKQNCLPQLRKYQLCMCTQILLNYLRWEIVK